MAKTFKNESIEVDVRTFGVEPKDIKLDTCGAVNLCIGFGKYETEIAAGKLIQYFQYRRKWCSVSFTELRAFYQDNHWDWNEMLYRLIPFFDEYAIHNPPVYIVHTGSGIMVTKEFINRCTKI